MGYRIDYQPTNQLRHARSLRSRRAAVTGLLFLLFVCLVCFLWPEGRTVLCGILFSGDPDRTMEALETFGHQLETGTEVRQALVQFGRNLLEGQ